MPRREVGSLSCLGKLTAAVRAALFSPTAVCGIWMFTSCQASAMASIARLNRIRRCNTISFASKFSPYKSLVTSIFFYGCEAWTLLTDTKKQKTRTWAFETKCKRNLLRISYLEYKTNDWVRSKINFL